jgi:sulfane dehydrogenase subunit SoxC
LTDEREGSIIAPSRQFTGGFAMRKTAPWQGSMGMPPLGRRAWLKRTALASGALLARAAHGAPAELPLATPESTRKLGAPILNPEYGLPSPHESEVLRRPTDVTPTQYSSWSFTPLQDLSGVVTPNGLFFERHHGGVPDIAPDAHQLAVHGLVKQPLLFTMDDLVRFPSVSRFHFLECSGNGSTEWAAPRGKTVQFTHGLLSCCEWTGVPLATVLEEAGIKPEAKWILAEGADAAAMTRSIPVEKALDDALLAYAQNGERLRPEQGYPLRLLLPGFEGNMNIKWLHRLKLGDRPFYSREETSKYTDLLRDGRAREFSFVMEAKSVITSPSGGQQLSRGPREISGVAWSGRGRITKVDVSTDGGKSWREAALQEPVMKKCLTRFRLPWRWDGAPAILQSRAVDETGYVQPSRQELVAVRGLNSYYHNNSIQSWQVAQGGEVANVHA